jgi:pimeloyl-ACP methyl ester carboxylesterase
MATLDVPGAKLHYEVSGSGPLIVFVAGARGEAAGFAPIAPCMARDHKVLIYDRRGFAGSPLDGPQDHDVRIQTDASDVARLIEAEGAGPGIVLGSSSGALVALQLLSDHPNAVAKLLAHEPPALTRLPPEDYERHVAEGLDMYQTYRSAGLMAALGPFIQQVMSDSDRRTLGEMAAHGDPAQMARGFDYWFEHELRQYPVTRFDDDKLTAGDKLTFLVGEDTEQSYARVLAESFARQLGVRCERVPGGHLGYATYPEAFADRLREILTD